MSDPLSIIASVTGVVAFGFQVSVTVANFINDVKDAPSYVLSLKNEIDGLSSMLQRLEEKLKNDFNGSPPYPAEVAKDLKDVLINLDRELKRVDKYMKELSIEGEHFRTWHSLIATVKRKYMEDDITSCQRKIEAYKGTLNGLVISTISYATTDIQKTSKDTLSVTKNVHTELQAYQQAAVEVMEKTATEVQKSVDLTEEVRAMMERFLLTVKSSTISDNIITTKSSTEWIDETREQSKPSNEKFSTSISSHQESTKRHGEKDLHITTASHQDINLATGNEGSIEPSPEGNLTSIHPNSQNVTKGTNIQTNDPTSSHIQNVQTHSKAKENRTATTEALLKVTSSDDSVASGFSKHTVADQPYGMLEVAMETADDPNISQALRTAAWNGNLEMLDTLLEIGANINSFDKMDGTALRMATRLGRIEAVEFLLRRGANPNLGKEWLFPIFAALTTTQTVDGDHEGKCLDALIASGANVSDPPIMQNAAKNCSPFIIQKLLNAGAKINVLAVDKTYPTLKLGSPLQAACLNGKKENISFLLKNSADPNLGAGRFENPLTAAINYVGMHPDDLSIIHELFSHGADSKTPGALHFSVFQTACGRSQALEIVRCLLDAGSDVNSLNEQNETALFQAALHGIEDTVALLLEHGANPSVGKSPIQAAVSNNHVGVLKLLKGKKAK